MIPAPEAWEVKSVALATSQKWHPDLKYCNASFKKPFRFNVTLLSTQSNSVMFSWVWKRAVNSTINEWEGHTIDFFSSAVKFLNASKKVRKIRFVWSWQLLGLIIISRIITVMHGWKVGITSTDNCSTTNIYEKIYVEWILLVLRVREFRMLCWGSIMKPPISEVVGGYPSMVVWWGV